MNNKQASTTLTSLFMILDLLVRRISKVISNFKFNMYHFIHHKFQS